MSVSGHQDILTLKLTYALGRTFAPTIIGLNLGKSTSMTLNRCITGWKSWT